MRDRKRDTRLQPHLLGLMLGALLAIALVWLPGGAGAARTRRVRARVEPVSLLAGSRLGGRVAEVCARTGEAVRKDQVLVRFDAALLRQQRAALAAALEGVRSGMASARLPEAGRRLLLDSHPDVARAEERYVEALAGFEKQPNDARARLALEQTAAQRMETRRRVGRLLGNAGEMAGAVSQVETLLSDLGRALADTEVRAPADAVVDVLDLHPGDRVLPGQPAAILLEPGEYFCEFAIPAADTARLQAGATGKGTMAGNAETFVWRVERVTQRTIPLALRESRDQAEEWVVRARFPARTQWVAGREAELQMP
jgi:multidrug resistance efflux pump